MDAWTNLRITMVESRLSERRYGSAMERLGSGASSQARERRHGDVLLELASVLRRPVRLASRG